MIQWGYYWPSVHQDGDIYPMACLAGDIHSTTKGRTWSLPVAPPPRTLVGNGGIDTVSLNWVSSKRTEALSSTVLDGCMTDDSVGRIHRFVQLAWAFTVPQEAASLKSGKIPFLIRFSRFTYGTGTVTVSCQVASMRMACHMPHAGTCKMGSLWCRNSHFSGHNSRN